MIIRFGDIESDQDNLSGKMSDDIFQLESGGDICSLGPVDCDLRTSISGEHVMIDGRLTTSAQLRCVNCLETFSYTQAIENYHAEVKIDNNHLVDVTEHLRDDILLEIPNYPHCEHGDQAELGCATNGPRSFETKDYEAASKEDGGQERPDIWGALEDLDTKES